MNGGPYGRGKAPERRCLKVQAWPEDDRRLWEAACRPSDVLDPEPGGLRANHAIMSNRKAEKGYGRWLTFLQIAERRRLLSPRRRASHRSASVVMSMACSVSATIPQPSSHA
jgi:hypothetical protein